MYRSSSHMLLVRRASHGDGRSTLKVVLVVSEHCRIHPHGYFFSSSDGYIIIYKSSFGVR